MISKMVGPKSKLFSKKYFILVKIEVYMILKTRLYMILSNILERQGSMDIGLFLPALKVNVALAISFFQEMNHYQWSS